MNAVLQGVVEDNTNPEEGERRQQTAQSVSLPQGESWAIQVPVVGQNGLPYDLTNHHGVMSVRRTAFSPTELFQRLTDSVDVEGGLLLFSGGGADTASARPHDYVMDFWIVNENTNQWYRIIPAEKDGVPSLFTVEDSVLDQSGEFTGGPEGFVLRGLPDLEDHGGQVLTVKDAEDDVEWGPLTSKGLLADRPSAAGAFDSGRLFYHATDEGTLQFTDGTDWFNVSLEPRP